MPYLGFIELMSSPQHSLGPFFRGVLAGPSWGLQLTVSGC